MLNSNALITVEQYLLYAGKYTETALTNKTLTDTEDHLTFNFPNTYLIEGTVTLYEQGSPDPVNITDNIETIDYEAGTVTFQSEHTGVTADYTYLSFNYSGKYNRYNIERLINSASQFVQQYTNRILKSATYTDEQYTGNNRQKLVLRQYPVTDVDSVKYNDSVIDPNEYSVTPEDAKNGMIFKQNGWTADSYLVGIVGEPDAPIRCYKITYTAGYTTIPSDIQDVVMQMITEQISLQKNEAHGLKSMDQGELSYTWMTPGEISGNGLLGTTPGINAKYTAVLNGYRRLVV